MISVNSTSSASGRPMRNSIRHISRGLLLCAVAVAGLIAPASASAVDFDLESFSAEFVDLAGNPATQAGAHADQVITFENTTEGGNSTGLIKDVITDLPAGFYGDPSATPTCKFADIIDGLEGICQPAAQVGTFLPHYPDGENAALYPIYNIEAPGDQAAVLAVAIFGIPIKIIVTNRPDGDKGLQARVTNSNQGLSFSGATLTLWGVPADPAHDAQRARGGLGANGISAGVPPTPFLSMPARCEPVTTTLRVDSWQNPGDFHELSSTTPPLTGCDSLHFDADMTLRPQVKSAGAPSALDVGLTIPQELSPIGFATPQLKKAEFTLPEGVTINPASADGITACSDADFAIGTTDPPNCPDASKIATTEVETHVLDDHLYGSVYLGEPLDQSPAGAANGDMFRGFLDIHGKGLEIKLAGKIMTDQATGQISAVFDDNPQLPFTELTFVSRAARGLPLRFRSSAARTRRRRR